MTDSTPQAALDAFLALIRSEEGRKVFDNAVMIAVRNNIHKEPFDIDKLTYLAAGIEGCKYAERYMRGCARFDHKRKLLDYAVEQIQVEGPVLEFGVFRGETINRIAELRPDIEIFGFDSFEGLPEEWLGWPPGTVFNEKGSMPSVRPNVQLIAGWFDRALPAFLDKNKFGKIALLHVDSDLYSSAQTIFAFLHDRIVPGTIILFDEYINFPSWERNEIQAFKEYTSVRNRRYEYIGLVPYGEQVAVRMLS